MIIKEFNNLEEIQKYYVKETNTYVFKEDDRYINLVIFNFDLDVNSNIEAYDINANNIDVYDIKAGNINALDVDSDNICAININANNISYYAVCFAYENIKCKSIKGRRKNHKHFVLDGVLEVEDK